MSSSFGDLLRLLRLRAHLSQRELARRVSYSDAQINRYERGLRKPDPSVVAARFVAALELAADSDDARQLVALASGRALDIEPTVPVLPPNAPELIGRDAEIAALTALIGQDDARLVTLTGPPGVGKTQLSMHMMRVLGDAFKHGAFFVALASIDDPVYIADAVLRALGLGTNSPDPLQQLVRTLRELNLLLVLDNFEQLLTPARVRDSTAVVATLIANSPNVKLLITSRTPLLLTAEQVHQVPPLDAADAATLFSLRARARQPSFEVLDSDRPVIAEICRRLDHLPLAIELATSRIRMLTPRLLLVRLKKPLAVLTVGPADLPARQRTLRDTIDWSHSLLTADEQRVFRRLGTLPDGAPLEALEAIAGPLTQLSVLDAAQGLVEKCLLVIVHYDDMTRIRPLEMVREYAAEQLVLRDDVDAVIQSAAEWYAGCIEQFQGDPSKSESAEWFDWFDREVNNIRALVDWSLRSNRVDLALRIVASLGLTWRLHGPLRDGHAIVTAVLSHPDIAQHPFLHARALIAAGHVNEEMGNNALARSYVTESVRMLRGLNAPGWLANALAILADHETALGNFEQAQVYLDESVPLARTSTYHHGTIAALLYQAFLLGMKGDPRGALRFYEDLAAQAEVLNSNFAACLASTFSSGIYWEFGDLHRARALAEEAVERAIELKLGASANISRNILGMILMDMGDRAGAAQLFIEAVDGTSAHGNPDVRADGLVLLAMLRHGDGDSATALVDLRSALRTYRAGGRHAGMPEVVHRIGWVLIDTGKTELGATLCGAANAWTEAVGINLPSRDHAAHTAHMAAGSAALGAVSFERAFQTGRAMDRDAVVELALSA